MADIIYFFDTYAFFEIIAGNPNYKKFETISGITTIFNLAEFSFALKREGKSFADSAVKSLSGFLTDVTIDDIINAMNFRLKNRALSAADAIGYAVAKRNNAIFLTGDKEFAKLPNVEFIK